MKRFALAGNPNSGKTTLFNSLTGSTAHVGNWPGVTVEKKSGTYKKAKEQIEIIDLPGIYSLSPYTSEEVVSRNYILDEHPDAIINIIDSTNLERNLYLTTQLLEINVPVIVALNMADVLAKKGAIVNTDVLEEKLGVPVVLVSALKEDNLADLMNRALEVANKPREGRTIISNKEVLHIIEDTQIAFEGKGVLNPLFHAIKLIEKDELETKMHPDLIKMVEAYKRQYSDELFGDDYEALIADARYKYITENFRRAIIIKEDKNLDPSKMTRSDKIDKVLTHRVFGLIIFAFILFIIFHFTFSEDLFFIGKISSIFGGGFTPVFEGTPYEGLFWSENGINSLGVILFNFFDMSFAWFTDVIRGLMESGLGENLAWLTGLVCDGILAGVFAILGFLPQILLLFLFFSIMEDTGYMARVAFIFDKVFRKFGLSGRAFIPMIMGFGCSIPAMVNTRTIADDKERTATIRVIPFFSCGAKLPILTAIAGAIALSFGFQYVDFITYSMYVVGVIVAIIAVLLMRNTTLKGKSNPFIMELPEYHIPQFKSLMIHLWDKAKHFVKKAFTIILASTIVIWFLSHFGFNWHYVDEAMDQSILAGIGQLMQPLFTPLGFGSQLSSFGWIFAVAIITGFIAKENVVAALATLAVVVLTAVNANPEAYANYFPAAVEELSEMEIVLLGTGISWQGAISFIAFNMLTIPCVGACATARAELPKGQFKWTLLFWVVASYVSCAVIYSVLSCFSSNGVRLAWAIPVTAAIVLAAIGTVVGVILWNKLHGKKNTQKGA